MTPIFAGTQCIGFVLARGGRGYEAFTAADKSIGTFASQREAVAAITGSAA
jgi:hypothetical protein